MNCMCCGKCTHFFFYILKILTCLFHLKETQCFNLQSAALRVRSLLMASFFFFTWTQRHSSALNVGACGGDRSRHSWETLTLIDRVYLRISSCGGKKKIQTKQGSSRLYESRKQPDIRFRINDESRPGVFAGHSRVEHVVTLTISLMEVVGKKNLKSLMKRWIRFRMKIEAEVIDYYRVVF